MEGELERLIHEQQMDDTRWQMPEPGVVSYDRGLEGEPTIEGFVRWFNEEAKLRSPKVKGFRKRKPTEAQRELMALALIREKHRRADGQEEVQPRAGVHRLEDQPALAGGQAEVQA